MIFHHILIDVFVADRRFGVVDAKLVKRFIKPEIRHYGGDDGVIGERAALLHITAADIENMVARNDIAFFVDTKAAVGVAVVGKADIQPFLDD